MTLKTKSWLQWAVFFVQIRSGKTWACNQITATKKRKPQSNFGDIVLVLGVAMEIWELSYFTFHIYQVTPAHSKWQPHHTQEAGSLLTTEPRGKARNAHAEPSQIHTSRQAWTRLATEYTELRNKYKMQIFVITLWDISHHAWASVRIQASSSSFRDVRDQLSKGGKLTAL